MNRSVAVELAIGWAKRLRTEAKKVKATKAKAATKEEGGGWVTGAQERKRRDESGQISGAEAEDRAYRAAYPGLPPLSSAYRSIVPVAPKLKAGDWAGAAEYLAKVEAAIDQGGWTRNERTRLYRLQDKWRRRAEGLDCWFEVVGNRGGGLTGRESQYVEDRKKWLKIKGKMPNRDKAKV